MSNHPTATWLCVLVPALVLSLCLSPNAQSDEAVTNDVCMGCHEVPGLDFNDIVSGEPRHITINPEAYARSVHGKAACVACHDQGYDGPAPHNGALVYPRFLCVDCHEALGDVGHLALDARREDLIASAHGKRTGRRMDCHQCHDPHTFSLVRDQSEARDRIKASNDLCMLCHGLKAERIFGYDDLVDVSTKVHESFPNAERHLRKIKCVACHAPSESRTHHDILPTSASVKRCGACHARTDPLYKSSYEVPGTESLDESRQNVYVIGASRSVLLDLLSQAGFLFVLLIILVHGIARSLRGTRLRTTPKPLSKRRRWVALWHFAQTLLFFVLLVSGLSMHYSGGLLTPFSFQLSVQVHNIAGVGSALLWGLFLIMNIASGNHRHYRDALRAEARTLKAQLRYYTVGMFRGESAPEIEATSRFNPVQGVVYILVMYVLMPLGAVSGLLLLFPVLAPEQALGHPGLWPMAMLHLTLGYLVTIFVAVHIYLATTEI